MSSIYPHELQIGDVYFAPFLIVFIMAFFLAVFTTMLLNKVGVARFFYAHAYVFLAFMVLYALVIDQYFIRF